MITAACGHKVTNDWLRSGKAAVYVKDFTRMGERALSYRVVCEGCRDNYARNKLILENDQQKQRWLGKREHARAHL